MQDEAYLTFCFSREKEEKRSKMILSGRTQDLRLEEHHLRGHIIANRAEVTWMIMQHPVRRVAGLHMTGDRALAGAAPVVVGEAAAVKEMTGGATVLIETGARPSLLGRLQHALKTIQYAPSSWKESAQEEAIAPIRTPLFLLAKWSFASFT